MRISYWSSDVCSSDLEAAAVGVRVERPALRVDHPPRRVAGGVDVPQFLDPKAIDLRLAIGVERELRLQHLGQMAAHALGKESVFRVEFQPRRIVGLVDRKSTRLNSSP